MTLSEVQLKARAEAEIKRNPHPDFKKVEASRPAFNTTSTFRYNKTPAPAWQFGSGANELLTPEQAAKKHISIDPYEEGRPAAFNYKLLISGIVPRPIAFVSSRSKDGTVENLAPFSYFQMVGSDPPLFVVGFVGALSADSNARDSLRNLVDSGECVINIVSEHYVEAANSTSINAPYGSSEWAISGLTPAYDCVDVKCARVKEAIFSIEAKLESAREFESRQTPGLKTSVLVVLEGTRFWVREDAINEDKSLIDPAVSTQSLSVR